MGLVLEVLHQERDMGWKQVTYFESKNIQQAWMKYCILVTRHTTQQCSPSRVAAADVLTRVLELLVLRGVASTAAGTGC